jgi:hypothetical protein
MQVRVKSSHFESFGGINFLESDYIRFGFETLITAHLGARSLLAHYSYSDLIKNLFFLHASGGEVLDDLNRVREAMKDHPDLDICSADTIEYASQELKQSTEDITTERGVTHSLNKHDGFNRLLPALCKKGKLLKSGKQKYTLDYDGHIVENTKQDNATSYKHTDGYYPIVCSINKWPVYMENRKANTPESYRQLPAIEQTFCRCEELKIAISRFRADACCYEKATIEYLESRPEKVQYYIRAEMNEGLRIALEDETDWQPAMLGYKQVEVCTINYPAFGGKKEYRIAAYRKKVTGQPTLFQQNGYDYHAVITGDEQSTPKEVIFFYNGRGCEGEHHFKELDYDFGWNKLPFDNMEMNTIYMYMTMVAFLLFNIFKHDYASKLDFVNPQMQLKNFIFHFVNVVARWIKSGRQWILNIYTPKNYSPLWQT